jgi:hypothetical protein
MTARTVKSAALVAVADKPADPPDAVITSLKGRRNRRAALDYDVLTLLPVLALLREAIDRRIDLTIRYADLHGLAGLSNFESGRVYLDHDLTDAELRWTLMHELLHHPQGPNAERYRDLEESRIEGAVATSMLDAAASLALQVHAERTDQDVADVDTNRARSRLIAAIERHLAGGAR